ncbi:LysR family transcriptional regulator [Paracoccus cavernae]|uniref:LysR family transcriptional regulator n=1 Tax=Paracoccus cavernae TaxID=1571207 RepID=A0ABT8D3V9_9RHOB|nr:LysR family transcriptional regulator [Paracoccus cavernae]
MRDLPDTTLLRSFLVLGEELNFRRAAERLALDQSALSRRIRKLEGDIGYALFERTTHEVSLTPAGSTLYQSASQVLGSYRSAIARAAEVAQGREGRVRVGYMSFSATRVMPRTVAEFERLYPKVRTELRYLHTQKQKLALANDEIDIGFLIGPYDNADYHSITLEADPLYLVTPRDHPLLAQESIRAADLADQRLILGDVTDWGEYRHRLEDIFGALGLWLSPAHEAGNTLGILGLVAAGLGVTVYPASLLDLLGKNLAARPFAEPSLRIETVLAWKRTNRSRAVLNFAEIAGRSKQSGQRG